MSDTHTSSEPTAAPAALNVFDQKSQNLTQIIHFQNLIQNLSGGMSCIPLSQPEGQEEEEGAPLAGGMEGLRGGNNNMTFVREDNPEMRAIHGKPFRLYGLVCNDTPCLENEDIFYRNQQNGKYLPWTGFWFPPDRPIGKYSQASSKVMKRLRRYREEVHHNENYIDR